MRDAPGAAPSAAGTGGLRPASTPASLPASPLPGGRSGVRGLRIRGHLPGGGRDRRAVLLAPCGRVTLGMRGWETINPSGLNCRRAPLAPGALSPGGNGWRCDTGRAASRGVRWGQRVVPRGRLPPPPPAPHGAQRGGFEAHRCDAVLATAPGAPPGSAGTGGTAPAEGPAPPGEGNAPEDGMELRRPHRQPLAGEPRAEMLQPAPRHSPAPCQPRASVRGRESATLLSPWGCAAHGAALLPACPQIHAAFPTVNK